ncbi:hypothetical protein B0H66DRAFT_568854 [Apodospora peruviana]|uniref:Uncharacterized protein n=1 Tax=Apodospora peruviana TaxID=516989 RepID=A0AAE0HUE0_9PEZI|nr:hypothetical protein B0H66DRAFT_568854 [Apodospora peruviana]
MEELDLLILGAGWTATFLIPLLASRGISFAATTTSGRPVSNHPTIPFKFDPSAPTEITKSRIAALPRARYILITFPLTGPGPSRLLAETYSSTHPTTNQQDNSSVKTKFRFIQLGSTGVWQSSPSSQTSHTTINNECWITRHSPLLSPTPRSDAEDELLSLGGCVLSLSGLYDGVARIPRNWIDRVGSTKELVRAKGSLHMIHGVDVARAIAAIISPHDQSEDRDDKWTASCAGQRWMLTDGFVYDWWSLFASWAEPSDQNGDPEPTKQAKWVFELMEEQNVRGLPRSMEQLKRCYDTREFWQTFGLVPLKAGRVNM